jgi:hypothetical protein
MLSRLFRQSRVLASSVLSAGVWLIASACGPGVATPMPEPPAATFDLDGINRGVLLTQVGPDLKEVEATYVYGGPDTVPGGATVRITNLDLPSMVSATTAFTNGAFTAVVVASAGQELRFEWLKGSQRSLPADAIAEPNPVTMSLNVAPSPRFECLSFTPGLVLDFTAAAAATLAIDNRCGEDVTFSNARNRLNLPDFQLQSALPLAVPAGQSAELVVDFTRAALGQREDVLLVDVTRAGATIRYPITLRAD